jgi:hypothetical protein
MTKCTQCGKVADTVVHPAGDLCVRCYVFAAVRSGDLYGRRPTCDDCGKVADTVVGRCLVCRVRHRVALSSLVWTDGTGVDIVDAYFEELDSADEADAIAAQVCVMTNDRLAIETRLTPLKCDNGLWAESVARARRNHPLLYRPCDECGVDVPEDEHCGATGRYLCPDCYGDSLS